jgi:plasmid stability protein
LQRSRRQPVAAWAGFVRICIFGNCFGRVAGKPPLAATSCATPVPVLEFLRHAERAEGLDLGGHFVDDGFDLVALGGGNPLEAHALLLDAQVLEHALEQLKAAEHLVVALDVMAVARMAAADQHAVGALGEGVEDELRIDAARAHQADDAHVRRVLQARHAGEVRRGVGAPVAEERHDAGSLGFRYSDFGFFQSDPAHPGFR